MSEHPVIFRSKIVPNCQVCLLVCALAYAVVYTKSSEPFCPARPFYLHFLRASHHFFLSPVSDDGKSEYSERTRSPQVDRVAASAVPAGSAECADGGGKNQQKKNPQETCKAKRGVRDVFSCTPLWIFVSWDGGEMYAYSKHVFENMLDCFYCISLYFFLQFPRSGENAACSVPAS